jgi:hypothetical protein
MQCGWVPLKSWGFLTCLITAGFTLWFLVAFQWQIHSLVYVQGCTSRVSSGRTVVGCLFSVTQTNRHCVVTDKPWIQQIIVLIYTTDKTVKIVSNGNRTHNKFKNHSHQVTLHLYIQYCGLIALTPISKTVLSRFASLAPHYAVPQLNSLYCLLSTLFTLLYTTLSESQWQDCPISAIRWLYIVLISHLELTSLF